MLNYNIFEDEPENPVLSSIYGKYPALKNMGAVTLKADPNFTRDKTGVGSIEYFGNENKGRQSIIYDNGFEYQHPKPGTHGIVYDPNTNDEQDIFLDMLHGMASSDPTYAKHRQEFGNAFIGAYGEDFQKGFQFDMQRSRQQQRNRVIQSGGDVAAFDKLSPREYVDQYTDGMDQFKNNWIDGQIRGLMFEGDDTNRKNKRYLSEQERNMYLSNPSINTTFNQLRNYLQTGQGYVLPEVEIKAQKNYNIF